MVARKTVCLRRLGGNRSGELRAGRFFASPKVTVARLVAGWSDRTGAACAGRHVLAIQDRCDVMFPTTAQQRRGLGPVKKGTAYGVLVHAMVAVDAASGSCLGLVGGDVWSRAGVNPIPHRKRPLAERESVHWVNTAEQAKPVLASAGMVTVVADREADMYPLWGAMWGAVPEGLEPEGEVSTPQVHLLIRASRDRVLVGGGALFAAPAQFPVGGRRTIDLPRGAGAGRAPGQPKRGAEVELRYGEVEIRRPEHESERDLPHSVRLRLVEVREVDPPAQEKEPLHWRLLTTHAIEDAACAWQIVAWYQRRWVIEQLFRVMKSQGLQLEDSQLTSADRLVKLAAMATKAACVDIQLTQGRDGADHMPAANLFSEPEIETLTVLGPTLEGKTERQQNHHPPNNLAWAAWIIARLGGWNCYYKPPGPITFRRGMEQFYAIHRGALLKMPPYRDV